MWGRAAPALALVGLLAACTSDDPKVVEPVETTVLGTTVVSTSSTTLGSGPVATTGSTTLASSTTLPVVTPEPDVEPTAATRQVAELEQPVDLAARPGDPAAYVVEQAGRVVSLDVATGDTTPVLDITDLTRSDGEQGLLGLVFHPTEPYAYVNYTEAADGDTVVAEYAVAADGTFDPASARTVITIEQPQDNHNGGGLAFGPDGYLYIGTGDGGGSGDPDRRAGDPFDLLGKLLRVDPRGAEPYAVPADNPFADGAAAAPEVWSLGLRNPWRFSFDPPTGDLWIADVGQNELEEVNRVTPADGPAGRGAHFGWSAFEGTERYNDDVEVADAVMPVLTYSHEQGCSVSGGAVYRGPAIPDLTGWYVYSDFCTGTLWAFDAATERVVVLADEVGRVTAVRNGPADEVFVLDHTGAVLQIVPG
ncbi:MAG TPA: PQQ-dependent sugar dehydrogenase [Ilumatobacter sp.]|nr:PQQ-dependent sugar dehydrogenase [Ilumatobacter sp.]